MTQARQEYMPQLDAIRAIAVSTVLLHHDGAPIAHFFPIGIFGVRLFFVLSGFLITGILLRQRDRLTSGASSAGAIARTFYARRALRLLPLYYIVLAVVAPTLSHPLGAGWLWHLFYGTNLCVAYTGHWCDFVPFWSLAVEEQFYLIWPWVILLVPTSWLRPIFFGALTFAPLVRFGLMAITGNDLRARVTLVGCMDSLAMGALLAIALRRKEAHQFLESSLGRRCFATVGLGALAMSIALYDTLGEMALLNIALQDTFIAIFSVWFVYRGAVGFEGWTGRILSSPLVVGVGRISYGIYVVHAFVPVFVDAPGLLRGTQWEWLVRFAFFTPITVVIAALSWHFIEGPISRMKDRVRWA